MPGLEKVFVRFKGRVLGPLTVEKASELVRRGQITRQHELSPDGQAWAAAESYTEFFPSYSSIEADDELELEGNNRSNSNAPVDSEITWYIRIENENKGPFPETLVSQMVETGKVSRNTLIWREGMANWVEAAVIKPGWFAKQAKSATTNAKIDYDQTADSEIKQIVQATLRSYGWAQFLAVLGLIVTPIWLIGSIAYFLFLVSRKGADEENIGSLLVSLAGFAFSAATLVAFLLLFRYTSLTGILRYQPSTSNLLSAQNALGMFWKFSGITTLVWLCVYMFLLMLFYIMGLKLLP